MKDALYESSGQSEETRARERAIRFGVPVIDLSSIELDADAIGLVPRYLALKHVLIPTRRDGNAIVVAMNDPLDIVAIDQIRFVTTLDVRPVYASRQSIVGAIERYYLSSQCDQTLDCIDFDAELEGATGEVPDTAELVDPQTSIPAVGSRPPSNSGSLPSLGSIGSVDATPHKPITSETAVPADVGDSATPGFDVPPVWGSASPKGNSRPTPEELREKLIPPAAPRRPADQTADPVDCTVFSPASAARDESFMVQVFAHTPEQSDEVVLIARELDDRSRKRAYKSLEIDVQRGTTLTFHLGMQDLAVDEAVQVLVWTGKPQSVQFGIQAPSEAREGRRIGTVVVSQAGVPVGRIKFVLDITARATAAPEAEPSGDHARRYRKAFISYASSDRAEVLKRVQMLGHFGIGFFQDVLNLEPGDRWSKELYRHIDESDVFLLFWSTAAKKSEWVMNEVRYAMGRKGSDDYAPPDILPVIIEGPPPVAPPPELAHLHFNDRLLYFKN